MNKSTTAENSLLMLLQAVGWMSQFANFISCERVDSNGETDVIQTDRTSAAFQTLARDRMSQFRAPQIRALCVFHP